MKPRPYQESVAAKALKSLKEGRSPLIVSPTGSGKTATACHLVDVWRATNPGQVLWLAHRRELLDQALSAVGRFTDMLVARGKPRPHGDIYVSTIQTAAKWPASALANVGLVVVDEAHRTAAATYQSLIDLLPNKKNLLGLTATPWRLDGKALGDTYDDLHVAAEVMDLIQQGYLVMPKIAHVSGQLKGGTCGDPVQAIQDFVGLPGTPGLSVITFCKAIGQANDLCTKFRDAGFKAEVVTGASTKTERNRILGGLADGTVEICLNVNLLPEGVDIPSLKAIQVLRFTESLTLWLQMCGRVMRPYEGVEKVIVDHGNNSRYLLPPWTKRAWSLDADAPVVSTPSETVENEDATPYQCPHCGFEGVTMRTWRCPACNGDIAAGYHKDEGELDWIDIDELENRVSAIKVALLASIGAPHTSLFSKVEGLTWAELQAHMRALGIRLDTYGNLRLAKKPKE